MTEDEDKEEEEEEAGWTNNRRGRGCGETDQGKPLCVYLGRIVVCLLFPVRAQWCSERGFAVFFREELREGNPDLTVPSVSRWMHGRSLFVFPRSDRD